MVLKKFLGKSFIDFKNSYRKGLIVILKKNFLINIQALI